MTTVTQNLSEHRYKPRGHCRTIFSARAPEVLLSGPAGTGKSRACLEKLHLLALMNPGMRGLICRKTASSLSSTALVTWRRFVAHESLLSGDVEYYGGSSQEPPSYRYSNGSVVAIGGLDKITKIMSSEYDCVVGETTVFSPTEIQRAYGRPYSGKLVTVSTASGNEMTGTPNHPVLTQRGWIGLGLLREGDYVLSRSGPEDVSASADPHVTDKPALITKIVRALAESGGGSGVTERVKTVPMDFHGDGSYGYVDVVTSARLFHDGLPSESGDPVPDDDGVRSDLDLPLLMRGGAIPELILSGNRALVSGSLPASEFAHSLSVLLGVNPEISVSGGSSGEFGLPLAVRVPDMPESLPFGRSTPGDSASDHLVFESGCADVNGLGDGHKTSLPCEVTLDRVVNISIADAGPGRHVYNLQTESNWYFANGIVSHNCIYVQEATELSENDWESLTTRLRNWRISFQQILGDCNPSAPTHWLKSRCDDGRCVMLETSHEDNPVLFDDAGNITENGKAYISKLDRLTGIRYQRLRLGNWVAAEGVIYEDFGTEHILDVLPEISGERLDQNGIPWAWPRYWGADFGYNHPFVLQNWALDPDGRLIMYREIFQTRRLVEEHAAEIMGIVCPGGKMKDGEWTGGTWAEPKPRAFVCDHDAEGRATLEKGTCLSTVPAHKKVKEGIEAVQSRLKVQDDGHPRVFFLRNAVVRKDQELIDASKPACTIEEIPGYVWAGRDKEEPLKIGDDGCDTTRYVCAELEFGTRAIYRSF